MQRSSTSYVVFAMPSFPVVEPTSDELRLSKGGFLYFWRSYLDPAWNHYIRGPVRVWSVDGGPDPAQDVSAARRRARSSYHPVTR